MWFCESVILLMMRLLKKTKTVSNSIVFFHFCFFFFSISVEYLFKRIMLISDNNMRLCFSMNHEKEGKKNWILFSFWRKSIEKRIKTFLLFQIHEQIYSFFSYGCGLTNLFKIIQLFSQTFDLNEDDCNYWFFFFLSFFIFFHSKLFNHFKCWSMRNELLYKCIESL